ncbi:MAG: protein translocase subunit SecF [Actinomycetota bacterium]
MTTATEPTADIPGVTRRHRPADFYHERTNFRFIAHSRRYLIVSIGFVLVSFAMLGLRGLNLGIDFEGGTAWQVKMEEGSASVAAVRDVLRPLGFADAKVSVLSGDGQSVRVQARVIEDTSRKTTEALAKYAGVTDAEVRFEASGRGGTFIVTAESGREVDQAGVAKAVADLGLGDPTVTVSGRDITLKVAEIPASPVQSVAVALAKYAGAETAAVSISTVGPTWGREVSLKALQALLIFFAILAVYLSLRFEWKMAASAIIAVVHDIIFTVGFYAIFRFEVAPATVTAFLTILGFSLYDTVVVFDKVNEYEQSMTATGRSTYGEMVDRALNAVLMRSLSTTLVALLPVVSLLVIGALVMGATALENFALALAVGLFIGAYSSIFVATPLLSWWKSRESRYRVLEDRSRRAESTRAEPAGIPGPDAVPRATVVVRDTITPRGRRPRGRKRR